MIFFKVICKRHTKKPQLGCCVSTKTLIMNKVFSQISCLNFQCYITLAHTKIFFADRFLHPHKHLINKLKLYYPSLSHFTKVSRDRKLRVIILQISKKFLNFEIG